MKISLKYLFLFCLCLLGWNSIAQFKLPQAKLTDERSYSFVLRNATLVVSAGQVLQGASLLVSDGKIVAVGKDIQIPAGIESRDLKGAWVYPSFIDLFSSYGMSAPTGKGESGDRSYPMGPQYESSRPGTFLWNQCLKPEFDASTVFQQNQKEAEELRKLGFGYVSVTPKDGIMRGSACLAALAEGENSKLVLKHRLFSGLSFQKGRSNQQYPSSQMGSIALLRQTFLDADWFSKAGKNGGPGMEALLRSRNETWLFETSQKYEILRASAIASEFGLKLLIKAKGDEYQRLDEIKAAGFPLLVSLQFPEMPDLEDPMDANLVSVADLKHWELAPYNASMLAAKQVPFAFTLADLKDQKSFLSQLRKVVECGLSEDEALAALTSRPASFAGMQDKIGSLKPGSNAAFFVASGNIFRQGSLILDHYVMGKRYVVNTEPQGRIGNFRLKIGNDSAYQLKITRRDGKADFLILASDTQKIQASGALESGRINFTAKIKALDTSNRLQFAGWSTANGFQGWFTGLKSGKSNWKAVEIQAGKDSLSPPKPIVKTNPGEVWYPFQAYGKPKQQSATSGNWLIKNATIWTNETEGILKETDLLVINGKISAIGKGLTVPAGAKVLDAAGRHITAGIIDEHSHIAISRGVNEGSSTTSMEVRLGDVVEADDINIYRHLAGGVTAVQQLHGSANAIGGQSSLIKMRWGKIPSQMKIEGAPGFIKFALGENVKQSNWGDFNTIRYPQTRMGVEQLFFDAFTKAKEYIRERDTPKAKTAVPFRRDLKLETLAEILEQKRFITCHSYVQSEINMLMHVADSMKFRVNTFTHILEGYKVADKMKKHGAGASTFSDWWAYKMEVKDAIPYNAALMQQHGLTVAINSDDAEMATRLNQEAAKTIKYGGVSEQEAMKMVTLNPAKLLHLDQKMGSLKVGKDADLVIWTDNPLSVSARAEKTFVDGEKLFDLNEEKEMDVMIQAERQRIIQKILNLKQGGHPAASPQPKPQHLWHCEDLGEE